MAQILIKNAQLVNEGKIIEGDILIKNDRIAKIGTSITAKENTEVVDVQGRMVIPGIIDDQVHFREPGLTHKEDISTGSRSAAAGGVTSFMEMPNTKPTSTTQERLQEKYDIAAKTSTVNYSFYMGATNDNVEEVLKTNPKDVCGVKIFMGSSTGNMLVDNEKTLDNLFSKVPMLIATHCEDEATIRRNLAAFKEKYQVIHPYMHPLIRNEEGCYLSSSLAVGLAKKHGTRLHILHISTAKEIGLFDNDIPLQDKKVTAEICVHHLYFDDAYYYSLGNNVKCNPAVKKASDREALLQGLKDGYFDVIATDHAPHTIEEKSKPYLDAPSGLPLVQHSLAVMMSFYHRGELSMEFIVDKMCHSPAVLFDVEERGYLREGYYADLAIVDPDLNWQVSKENIAYKCGWSPLENFDLTGKVTDTLCNGKWVYRNNQLTGTKSGMRLRFTP